MKAREAYRILRVPPDSDGETVRRSYRTLLKRYHPDLAGSRGDAEKLDRVVEAFRTLSEANLIPPTSSTRASRAPRASRASRAPRAPHAPRSGRSEARMRTGASGASGPAGRKADGASDSSGAARRRSARAGAADTANRSAHSAGLRDGDIFQLGELLLGGETPETRAFAARRLGATRRRWAAVFLRHALQDEYTLVVRSAVAAIGELRAVQCAGELAALFCNAETELRHGILDAVEAGGRPAAFRGVILEAMKVDDGELRRRALRLFAQSKREEVG